MARFYDHNGHAVMEVPYAGKRGAAGETRPPNIADARKLGLLPSVTTVTACWSRPWLENWKCQNAAAAAANLLREPGESIEDFAIRATEAGRAVSDQAAQTGTNIHSGIEEFLRGVWPPASPDPAIARIVDAFGDWWGANSSKLKGFVVDFKTQSKPYAKDFARYDEWSWQLAAYAAADLTNLERGLDITEQAVIGDGYAGRVDYLHLTGESTQIANVIISSVTPGEILWVPYSDEEHRHGLGCWSALLTAWRRINKWEKS